MEERGYRVIDLCTVNDKRKFENKAELLAKDKELYDKMLEEGISRIKMAKTLHDDLEKSYIGSMDFGAVTRLRNKTIERIKMILKSK